MALARPQSNTVDTGYSISDAAYTGSSMSASSSLDQQPADAMALVTYRAEENYTYDPSLELKKIWTETGLSLDLLSNYNTSAGITPCQISLAAHRQFMQGVANDVKEKSMAVATKRKSAVVTFPDDDEDDKPTRPSKGYEKVVILENILLRPAANTTIASNYQQFSEELRQREIDRAEWYEHSKTNTKSLFTWNIQRAKLSATERAYQDLIRTLYPLGTRMRTARLVRDLQTTYNSINMSLNTMNLRIQNKHITIQTTDQQRPQPREPRAVASMRQRDYMWLGNNDNILLDMAAAAEKLVAVERATNNFTNSQKQDGLHFLAEYIGKRAQNGAVTVNATKFNKFREQQVLHRANVISILASLQGLVNMDMFTSTPDIQPSVVRYFGTVLKVVDFHLLQSS